MSTFCSAWALDLSSQKVSESVESICAYLPSPRTSPHCLYCLRPPHHPTSCKQLHRLLTYVLQLLKVPLIGFIYVLTGRDFIFDGERMTCPLCPVLGLVIPSKPVPRDLSASQLTTSPFARLYTANTQSRAKAEMKGHRLQWLFRVAAQLDTELPKALQCAKELGKRTGSPPGCQISQLKSMPLLSTIRCSLWCSLPKTQLASTPPAYDVCHWLHIFTGPFPKLPHWWVQLHTPKQVQEPHNKTDGRNPLRCVHWTKPAASRGRSPVYHTPLASQRM